VGTLLGVNAVAVAFNSNWYFLQLYNGSIAWELWPDRPNLGYFQFFHIASDCSDQRLVSSNFSSDVPPFLFADGSHVVTFNHTGQHPNANYCMPNLYTYCHQNPTGTYIDPNWGTYDCSSMSAFCTDKGGAFEDIAAGADPSSPGTCLPLGEPQQPPPFSERLDVYSAGPNGFDTPSIQPLPASLTFTPPFHVE
jgi:hypothetical protein